ncbi:MAG: 16S rRNA (guanine(966)-N(2))-methyltransferase RsmD [Chromatiaceae bacterium]|nr:16S rRNA (guanine(966)-N(2))-methyltransferase RsmD [Chromatiaceae bacterium]
MGRSHRRRGNDGATVQARQIRIIGGEHRGRKLSVPMLTGLRPTGDRVRETLFNWLQPILPGAHCLDLFAGSGALGLEAASRGAGRVVMLDSAPMAVRQIEESAARLEMRQIAVYCVDAMQWLNGSVQRFDIVFLDPPFADDLLEESCRLLQQRGWLQRNARAYVEMAAGKALPQLPSNWVQLRGKKAGQVCYYLFSCGCGDPEESAW